MDLDLCGVANCALYCNLRIEFTCTLEFASKTIPLRVPIHCITCGFIFIFLALRTLTHLSTHSFNVMIEEEYDMYVSGKRSD